MFSRFFIDRPIFASVLSIVIALAGGLALMNLPLAQYPPVAPPQVSGQLRLSRGQRPSRRGDGRRPHRAEVNGVENMLYMSSQCTNDGTYRLTVTFKQGMNLNLAQVLLQNRVNLALPMLPDVLKRSGRDDAEDVARHPHVGQPQFAARPLRPALLEQLRA